MSKICSAFILVLFVIHRIQCEVTKCCPEDEFFETTSKSCLPSNGTIWDKYNIARSEFPICNFSINYNIFEGGKTNVILNGCIDKDINDKFVSVSCSQNIGDDVHLMNKCCPIGSTYDHMNRACTNDSGPNAHSHFKRLFANAAVVFEYGVPECSNDEVEVEYFSTAHSIRFSEKSVKVNGDPLSPNTFCIEDLINVDPSEASETSESERHMVVRSCRPRSVCQGISCMRRCCKADQVLVKKPFGCQQHPENANLKPVFYDVSSPLINKQSKKHVREYGVIHTMPCARMYPLNPNDDGDIHYLNSDGKLHVINKEPYDQDNYCIENVLFSPTVVKTYTFLCPLKPAEDLNETKFEYYPYMMAISCFFLAITLIVYLMLPKLLNIHGKTLVCYVISLLVTYTTLVILQTRVDRGNFCHEMAYLLLYSVMATFCWQTVMCFDIWLTFGSLRSSFAMRHNSGHRRRFFYYSAYAWVLPFVWCLFTWFAERNQPLPNGWNPSMSEMTCFLNEKFNLKGYFLFLTVPSGVHVVLNCILFVITGIHCSQVKADIHRMQSSSDESTASSKRKKFLISRAMFVFIMNLKLFTVMGISWVLEILTTFYKNDLEIILDTYNLFLGVLIFFIFVFKRKVLHELKSRFGFISRNTGMVTPRSTTVTNTMNISMKDISCISEKNLPLLTGSTTLQVPSVKN